MSRDKPECSQNQAECNRPEQVLRWAMCHPGVLLLSSVAVGALLACGREFRQQVNAERQKETETDIIDGDIPLFI